MEVLVLGLCRTGTTSIKLALKQLGYNDVHDTQDVWEKDHSLFWTKAIERKQRQSMSITMARNELDEILEKYDCIADIPAAIFARDLVAAYPEAKVVLTIRDEQSWYDSMVETVANPRYETAYYRLPRYFDAQLARFSRFCDRYSNMLWHNDFPRYGKQLFRDHNDMVRQLVAKDNLLEFQASQGWEPLCKFLDKKVPEGPYPRTHNWRIYQQEDDAYMQMLYKGTFKKVALALSPVALGFGAWWLGFLRFEV